MQMMQAPLWRELALRLDTLEDVTARIVTTLVERASADDGGWGSDCAGRRCGVG